MKWVFDGWDLAGVTTFTSGAPLGIGYSLVSGTDIVGGGGAGVDSRAVLTGNPNLPKSERTEYRHFNVDVVRPPTKADFGIGNAPKDPIRGPGINVFDVSPTRTSRSPDDESGDCNSASSSTTSSTMPASRAWIQARVLTPPESR